MEKESQKVRLPCSASPTGIQRHFTLVNVSDQRNPIKSRFPAILSTVSNQRLCPTQLDCEISRIHLKLHKLYAKITSLGYPLSTQSLTRNLFWSIKTKEKAYWIHFHHSYNTFNQFLPLGQYISAPLIPKE